MSKKKLYILDSDSNEVDYYINSDDVIITPEGEDSVSLSEFYEAYDVSSSNTINANTGRLRQDLVVPTVLASMGYVLDGRSYQNQYEPVVGDYIYVPSDTPGENKIHYIKETGFIIFNPIKDIVYCNAQTRKQYIWDPEADNGNGDMRQISEDINLEYLSDNFIQQTGILEPDSFISPSQSRIVPVESMGAEYDDVDSDTAFNYQPGNHEGNPGLFIKINSDTNSAALYNTYDNFVCDVNTYTRYINRHTGRSYRWSGSTFVEETTPNSGATAAAVVPYVGQNGNWWVGDVDQNVPATPNVMVDIDPVLNSTNDNHALSASMGAVIWRELLKLHNNVDTYFNLVCRQLGIKYESIIMDSSRTSPVYCNVTTSGTVGFIFDGESTALVGGTYQAIISPKSNYQIVAVNVTMDGGVQNLFSAVNNGGIYTINVLNVTGDIRIFVRTAGLPNTLTSPQL